MSKINHEEYKILKVLDDQWRWIARDSGGDHEGHLFVYSEKPHKNYHTKDWRGNFLEWLNIDNHLFQFILWEDEEPCSIVKLIKDYEFGKILLAMAEEETVWELEYENEEEEEEEEEEEVKDLELLKEEIETEIRMWDGAEGGWAECAVDKILNLIDEFFLSNKGGDCDNK